MRFTEVAISPNSNEVHIYAFDGKKWALQHVLAEVGLAPHVMT